MSKEPYIERLFDKELEFYLKSVGVIQIVMDNFSTILVKVRIPLSLTHPAPACRSKRVFCKAFVPTAKKDRLFYLLSIQAFHDII